MQCTVVHTLCVGDVTGVCYFLCQCQLSLAFKLFNDVNTQWLINDVFLLDAGWEKC